MTVMLTTPDTTIDLFGGEQRGLEKLSLDDADIRFQHDFYAEPFCRTVMSDLQEQTPWHHAQITIFGKRCWQPRLVALAGDAGVAYSYSGLTLPTMPWTPLLQRLRDDVERASGHRFNSVLMNLYRDQHDSMGWHSDDEAALGREPVIASLSFGATREFKLKHKTRADLKTVRLALTQGSLLLMAGSTQRCWKHAVDKARIDTGPRINLTFRHSLQRG